MQGSESDGQADLHELNPKSAGVGAWVLKVYKMRVIEYEYTWQGAPRKTQKLECMLVAANGSYCQGVIRSLNRGGGVDPAAELKQMKQKFQDGTVWRMTKVSLADEKSQYIASSLKKCIDMRQTKCSPVLQGLEKMPPAPAVEEELQSIVALHRTHRRHEFRA